MLMTGQVEVVVVVVVGIADQVVVLVEDVAVVDPVGQVVGRVVVKHRKKMMNYCPQKSLKTSQGLFFAFSLLLLVFLGVAISDSFLAECHHLENHCRLLVPTSSQIAGYPGVC